MTNSTSRHVDPTIKRVIIGIVRRLRHNLASFDGDFSSHMFISRSSGASTGQQQTNKTRLRRCGTNAR
jgi:hypothetical protein